MNLTGLMLSIFILMRIGSCTLREICKPKNNKVYVFCEKVFKDKKTVKTKTIKKYKDIKK